MLLGAFIEASATCAKDPPQKVRDDEEITPLPLQRLTQRFFFKKKPVHLGQYNLHRYTGQYIWPVYLCRLGLPLTTWDSIFFFMHTHTHISTAYSAVTFACDDVEFTEY